MPAANAYCWLKETGLCGGNKCQYFCAVDCENPEILASLK